MKTRIMILACLLAVPAGRMAAQQQTDPEQKATVQTQGDSIIIRKGKGDMRIKVYEEQLEDGEKKEVQIYEGVYLEKVDATSALSSTPCHSSPKREDTMLTNRTVPVCILATAGWLTTSFPSEQATSGTRLIQVMGIRLQHPLRISQLQEEPALGNQPGSQLGIPFFQYRR